MANNRKEREQEQRFATHDEIQKRAHAFYLARGGEHGQDLDDWFSAEQQLSREHDERVRTRTTTFVAGPDGVAKTDTVDPEFTIEKARAIVRAAEDLKEASTVPRTKTVSVGQQRNK